MAWHFTSPPARPDAGGRTRARLPIWGWSGAVVLYFAWEAVSYRGLFARAAEWQFDHLREDFPTFTFGVLTALFAVPSLVLALRRRRRDTPDASARTVDAGRDTTHFLMGFAVALAIAAVAALGWAALLPTQAGHRAQVSLGSPGVAADGPATVHGVAGRGRVAAFDSGILFLRHPQRFVPLLAPGGHDVRAFAELGPSASTGTPRGILMRANLPGPLLRLYRDLGTPVARPYYVLYASALSVRWPYYLAAIQFAIGAGLFLLAAGWQHGHVRRLRRLTAHASAA